MRPLFSYASAMILKEILIEQVNVGDDTFRISEELDSESMLDSLREIGQLNPVLLLDGRPQKLIVCGFRRIRALRRLGKEYVIARVLSEEPRVALHGLSMALWDNLSHRQLNTLEKARALFKLRTVGGVSDDALIKTYLPLLGLTPHESILRAYISLNGITSSLRKCLADGRLTISSVEYLAGMPSEVQNRIAVLMDGIRLSASLQKKVLILLEELSVMAGNRLDAALDNPDILSVLEDSTLSPFEKGDKVHAVIYRLKYPTLSRALERFHEGRKLLGLPGSIHITPHPFFERTDLKVEFEAPGAERFRHLADILQKAAHSPELEALYRIV
jgi:uncharacterized ParB-like nuclease family protein